ncbi:hypothetical protein J5N97_015655 [Dioscorea zingiberensis]|uniref:Uncharacterized protein n=1 Tax=Dioscorea zingiberensis TaxID=325984 RepID=A0A9D5CKD5_9LILI|nr:hypothetical protein J5N97_015655 [Dioscorea zingiberensis]
MLCGTGSFSHIDEDEVQLKKKQLANNNINPYSNRGLDKFSAVLAELDARREKIMAKAKDVSMVRFMYNDSHEWVPIIVKLRDDHHQNQQQQQPPKVPKEHAKPPEMKEEKMMMIMEKKKSFELRTSTWGITCYYWSVVMVLIMVCLFMFGRVFAICCTSIWWYLVPSLQTCRNKKYSFKKHKDYARKFSDVKTKRVIS